MASLTIDAATTVEDFKVLFHRSEAHCSQLEQLIVGLRQDTDVAVTRLNTEMVKQQADAARAAAAQRVDKIDLIDSKMIAPTSFDGTKLESFKPWAKQLKAF